MEDKQKEGNGEERQEERGLQEQKEEKALDKMTAKELREIAMEIPGVTGVHAMKKDQLLKVIKEARGIKESEKKAKGTKKQVNVKDLKKKISRLKEEKETARRSRDRKTVEILRRRINRLKKQTRKAAHA